MTVGVQIRNTNNVVQIDTSYQNFALRQKGTVVSGSTNVGGTGWSQATITVPSSVVIAFRCAAQCYISSSSASGGNKTVTFWVNGLSVSIDWFAFDTPDLGQSYAGSYGLKIRRPDGSVAFDSRMKYMRVIGQLSGGGPTANINETHNYSGTSPAIVQGQARYISTLVPLTGTGNPTDPPGQYVFRACVGSVSGSSVTLIDANPGAHTYDRISQAPSGLASAQYYFDFLVIDVTSL
jgi:hypothetical protein